jgi:hypothetical protein
MWIEYAEHLQANLASLHVRVHTGAYRALPSRRKYIPKADGRQRLLGITAIEDKIVQAAVVTVLTPIYESEFLGFSYGFRPKRKGSRNCCMLLPTRTTNGWQRLPARVLTRADRGVPDRRIPRPRRSAEFSLVGWRCLGRIPDGAL